MRHAFVTEALTDAHDLDGFDSGQTELDAWLCHSAAHAAKMRNAATFVECHGLRVVGFYALAAHQILRDDLPGKIGRGSTAAVPAVLLAKLALDRSLHGQGRGGELLADAMSRIVLSTRQVAARVVVVDAIDQAAALFYIRHGFVPTPDPFRLVQRVSTIAEAVGR